MKDVKKRKMSNDEMDGNGMRWRTVTNEATMSKVTALALPPVSVSLDVTSTTPLSLTHPYVCVCVNTCFFFSLDPQLASLSKVW